MRQIFENLMRVDSESFFEEPMIDHVTEWLEVNVHEHFPIDIRPECGVLTGVRIGPNEGKKRAVMFSAHLDTKGAVLGGAVEGVHYIFDDANRRWGFPMGRGAVGVDDRTGIAVILSTLREIGEAMNGHANDYGWVNGLEDGFDLLTLFTVTEEVGQLGSLRMPVEWLTETMVRHTISIDRHSYGRVGNGVNAQGRHYVSSYRGVQLLSDDDELHELIGQDHFPHHPNGELSPNCADALEIKGRWLAEHVLPSLDPGNSLIDQYDSSTEQVRKCLTPARLVPEPNRSALVGMSQPPRADRYRIIKEIQDFVEGHGDMPEEYELSAINLSMNLPQDHLELEELTTTERILRHFLEAYSD